METGKTQNIHRETTSRLTAGSCQGTSSLHRPSSRGGGGGVALLAALLSRHPQPWGGPEHPRHAGNPPKAARGSLQGSCSDLGHSGQTRQG